MGSRGNEEDERNENRTGRLFHDGKLFRESLREREAKLDLRFA